MNSETRLSKLTNELDKKKCELEKLDSDISSLRRAHEEWRVVCDLSPEDLKSQLLERASK